MPAVTGMTIAKGVFGLLGVYAPNETPDTPDGEVVRTFMNDLLSEWSQRTAFIPVIARERFDLVADQGGEDDPYTIGDGGDFDTERPPNQDAIVSANLILTTTSPEVRVPLGIYTDDAYNANALPGMSNGQPTSLYYNPTYAGGLGSIYLWPVPDVATNDIELFLQKSVASFANLSTSYYVPDGLPRALKYNVADAIQSIYGKTLAPSDQRQAVSSLDTFKRSNHRMRDLANDATFSLYSRTYFNIQTGQ